MRLPINSLSPASFTTHNISPNPFFCGKKIRTTLCLHGSTRFLCPLFFLLLPLRVLFNKFFPRLVAQENTDIPLVVQASGDKGSQDESIDIPVIAEISEPEGIIEINTDRPLGLEGVEGSQDESYIPATMEVNERESCNVQPIVNVDTTKIRPRVFSRYLSPHTSSCHDFCKYGTKHSLEEKPASSVLRTAKSVGGDDLDLRKIKVSTTKQNKDAIISNSSLVYNAINITELKEGVISSPEMVTPSSKRLLPPIKEVQVEAVHYSRTKLNLSQSKASSFAGQVSSQTKRNKEVRKGKKQDGDGSSSSCTNSTSRRLEINISAEKDIKASVPQAVSWTKRTRVKRVGIVDKKTIGRRGLKNQSPIKVKPDPSNGEGIEEKTLYMIEPSTKIETDESAHPQNSVHTTELYRLESSSATDNSLKCEREADETSIVPPLLVKMDMRRDRNGTSSKNLSTSPAVPKGFTCLKPKRLGMVQSFDTRSAPSSPSLSRCPSEFVRGEHSGRTSGHESKVEHMIKTLRMTQTDSENGACQSRTLKFRKERMVELQTETLTPRRLKFRRVRLLGETQSPKSHSRKRIIQHKDANQNIDEVKESENSSLRQQDKEIKKKKRFRRKETMDGKLVSSKSKSEKIVLRYRHSKGKKENQNLFNNAIEETTGKLAETRKSKVKALVGAFETVISLQDTRQTATIVHNISCSFHI